MPEVASSTSSLAPLFLMLAKRMTVTMTMTWTMMTSPPPLAPATVCIACWRRSFWEGAGGMTPQLHPLPSHLPCSQQGQQRWKLPGSYSQAMTAEGWAAKHSLRRTTQLCNHAQLAKLFGMKSAYDRQPALGCYTVTLSVSPGRHGNQSMAS